VARSTTALAGPAPYWHSYEYSGPAGSTGSRTKETWHATTGDTVRNYSYFDQGGAAGSKPHAVEEVATTGAATRNERFSYDGGGKPTRHVGRHLADHDEQTASWAGRSTTRT
jgi:hypothetical protein